MVLNLREACISDVPLLKHWDQQPHVIQCDPNDDWNWDVELLRNPEWREMLIAEIDGRPVGFMQIIDAADEETHYWGIVDRGLKAIDIWIGDANDLGKGMGTAMMQAAIERCFGDDAVTAILIDPLASNTKAQRFYERLGFQFQRQQRFGEDDCFVYRLTRIHWLEQQSDEEGAEHRDEMP